MIPDANQVFLLRVLFVVLSLENEVPPKREFFAEVPRAPGFDFQCRNILSKDGLKKSNPVIAAIIIGFLRWFRAVSPGSLAEAASFFNAKTSWLYHKIK